MIFEGITSYLDSLTWLDYFLTFLDIAIVTVIIYYALVFIKGTKASKIVYGLLLIAVILILGRLLNLKTLNWVIEHLATLVVVAIPVVFQPELRRALEKLGRTKLFFKSNLSKREKASLIGEVVKSVKILKQNKIGALIVLKRQTGLDDYIETGTEIDGKVSAELLLNIFFPKSPLHDGAVIIQENEIAAAGVVLPLSEGKYSYTHGTRHRAALGLSENTDAVILVVSEERGMISLASDGKIDENITINKLTENLGKLI